MGTEGMRSCNDDEGGDDAASDDRCQMMHNAEQVGDDRWAGKQGCRDVAMPDAVVALAA